MHGLDTGGRGYPFCATQTPVDGAKCTFTFCPSLDYVLGCSLNPACLSATLLCTDGEAQQDRFEVPIPEGRHRGARAIVDRDGLRIVLRCSRYRISRHVP